MKFVFLDVVGMLQPIVMFKNVVPQLLALIIGDQDYAVFAPTAVIKHTHRFQWSAGFPVCWI